MVVYAREQFFLSSCINGAVYSWLCPSGVKSFLNSGCMQGSSFFLSSDIIGAVYSWLCSSGTDGFLNSVISVSKGSVLF